MNRCEGRECNAIVIPLNSRKSPSVVGYAAEGKDMMTEKQPLLESIANTIADYREGEIARPAPEHVDNWVGQFDVDIQLPLLSELDHVLKKTYFNRRWVSTFLGRLVKNDKLAGNSPGEFWKNTGLLNIQLDGHSQEEMLQLFSEHLLSHCDLKIEDCNSAAGLYFYLDDAIFSGTRAGNDLSKWIKEEAPSRATIHVVAIALHQLGKWQVEQRLKKEAKAVGKDITFQWWRAIAIENRKQYRRDSEVLWPTAPLPTDEQLQAYIAEDQKYPFVSRPLGGAFENNIFSSEEGRKLLEQEMLLAGVRIRSLCREPKSIMRPLGFSHFGLSELAKVI